VAEALQYPQHHALGREHNEQPGIDGHRSRSDRGLLYEDRRRRRNGADHAVLRVQPTVRRPVLLHTHGGQLPDRKQEPG